MNPGSAEEITRLIEKAQLERAGLDQTIRWLQRQLAEIESREMMSSLAETLSVRQKCSLILSRQPVGMTLPALLAELRKHGFTSNSDNPMNVVNTILNRSGPLFARAGDRWFHRRFAPPPAAATNVKPTEAKAEEGKPPDSKSVETEPANPTPPAATQTKS